MLVARHDAAQPPQVTREPFQRHPAWSPERPKLCAMALSAPQTATPPRRGEAPAPEAAEQGREDQHPEGETRRDIYYNRKPAGGAFNRDADVRVSQSNTVNQLPAIAVDDQGRAHVVWSSEGDGVPGDIYYKRIDP